MGEKVSDLVASTKNCNLSYRELEEAHVKEIAELNSRYTTKVEANTV